MFREPTLTDEDYNVNVSKEEEPAGRGDMHLLYAMEKEESKIKSLRGNLMYVNVFNNGEEARVMIDTSATQNFIIRGEAIRLGMRYNE